MSFLYRERKGRTSNKLFPIASSQEIPVYFSAAVFHCETISFASTDIKIKYIEAKSNKQAKKLIPKFLK
jgi:predicted transcriptional regulator